MTLNHVHLGTKDLAAIQNFYEIYFGFKKIAQHNDGIFLSNSMGFMIAIDPVDDLPKFPDWYHVGFCLDTAQQVLGVYQKMKLGGEQIVRDLKTSTNEYASFFVKDPDGNKIEVSWHNE